MRCSKCGCENPANNRFCQRCGTGSRDSARSAARKSLKSSAKAKIEALIGYVSTDLQHDNVHVIGL